MARSEKWKQLEALGEVEVRRQIAEQSSPQTDSPAYKEVMEWLRFKETERNDRSNREQFQAARSAKKAAWIAAIAAIIAAIWAIVIAYPPARAFLGIP